MPATWSHRPTPCAPWARGDAGLTGPPTWMIQRALSLSPAVLSILYRHGLLSLENTSSFSKHGHRRSPLQEWPGKIRKSLLGRNHKAINVCFDPADRVWSNGFRASRTADPQWQRQVTSIYTKAVSLALSLSLSVSVLRDGQLPLSIRRGGFSPDNKTVQDQRRTSAFYRLADFKRSQRTPNKPRLARRTCFLSSFFWSKSSTNNS